MQRIKLSLHTLRCALVIANEDMVSDTLRVGLIGTGFGKTTQMPGFEARADVQVVAVCSGHLAKAQAVAHEHHIASAYDDYRAMLAAERLDIVSITTPPHLHKEMALASFAAGAHVLCEKPMAMDAAECEAMCDAARAAKRIGMIDHEFRYLPGRAYLKQLIDDGYIGKPYHINITAFNNFRADPMRPFNWWSEASKGGGMLGAIGSHYTDAIRMFGGEIESVCGFVHTQIKERPDPSAGSGHVAMHAVTSDDNCAYLARLTNGATASVHLSAIARPASGERIQVFGAHGTLVLDGAGKVWGGQASDAHLAELTIPDALKSDGAGLIGPFKVLLARMVDGILRLRSGQVRDGASDVTPSFADGLAVQRVLDAVRASSAGAGWVNVVA
ncbi:MAG: Gfo/Idh/MocA family oxidoreductase [Chloroflexota bacterium]